MKKKYIGIGLLSITILAFGFSSCKIGYTPSPVNVPLFEQKGQFTANASIGFPLTLQAAYAITDEFLILGDLNVSGDTGLLQRQRFFNHSVGFGYYTKFDKRVASETVVGVGLGRTEDIEYTKFYFQQSFGSISDYFEFAFTPRVTFANYKNQPLANGRTQALDAFLEPTFTFRGGSLPLKAHMQLGLSVPMRHQSELDLIPFIINAGLVYKIPARKRLKPPDPLLRNDY